jgi:hypothetical protein
MVEVEGERGAAVLIQLGGGETLVFARGIDLPRSRDTNISGSLSVAFDFQPTLKAN